MGVAELVTAFNSVSKPAYVCSRATLGYERHDEVESQVLTFYGRSAAGQAFTQRSDRIRANGDVMKAARDTAQNLLDNPPPA